MQISSTVTCNLELGKHTKQFISTPIRFEYPVKGFHFRPLLALDRRLLTYSLNQIPNTSPSLCVKTTIIAQIRDSVGLDSQLHITLSTSLFLTTVSAPTSLRKLICTSETQAIQTSNHIKPCRCFHCQLRFIGCSSLICHTSRYTKFPPRTSTLENFSSKTG
jgi:hypothetical protein